MEKGKLIVMEGSCDGVGKSTQSTLLKEHLEKDGKEIITHHFPTYNTTQAKLVEYYLSGRYGTTKELSPYFINSLYAVDRAVTWNEYLKGEYLKGKYILLDRYTTSSMIYQSAEINNIQEKKDFINYVIDYEYNKLRLKEPDQVLFLYGPYEVFYELRHNRKENDGIKNDIHESSEQYMRKVYDSAMFIANYLNWDMVNCCKDNKIDTIENIHNKVYSLIKK